MPSTDTSTPADSAAPMPTMAASTAGTRWVPEFVLLAALWGASFLFMRLSAPAFGPVPTAGLRVSLAALFLLPLLLHRGEWPVFRQHWPALLFNGIVNSAIPFALFSWAVLHIATGMASILNASTPLLGALVAWMWLGDRITGLRWLGLAVGFAGVALLALHGKPGAEQSLQVSAGSYGAIAACICASLSYAVAASFAKKFLTGLPVLSITTGNLVGAALGLALPTAWLWPAQAPGIQSWMAVAALALLCTSIAYLLYFRIIQRAGPSRALAVTFVAPVFALLYGNWFLGEPVTLWMLGCGALIICGTMLSTGLIGPKK